MLDRLKFLFYKLAKFCHIKNKAFPKDNSADL